MGYRKRERGEILEMIDRYLSGELSRADAVRWATLAISDDPGRKNERVEDHIIGYALASLMMLSENEPEEFRTTRQQLLQSRAYLTGEQAFPSNRIPRSG
jgi:hypothetical protein